MGEAAVQMNGPGDWAEAFERRGVLRREEPMARHSSWRCGGPAERYAEPRSREELAELLGAMPPDEPRLWLGLGSNTLIRDGGVRGTVIVTNAVNRVAWLDDERLEAECGATCARLARECAARDRAGLEFLAGIPGTLGGALAMNAGAHGGEIWSYVESVETVDAHGGTRRRNPDEFEVGYRHVDVPEGESFLSAVLRLPDSANGDGPARVRAVVAQRAETQPTGKATCGSVFKNPPGDFAGRLVEACGLKGHRIGGCAVSRVHANFIENDGAASGADIERLVRHVQAVVEARHGVRLEPEVRFVGEPDLPGDVA